MSYFVYLIISKNKNKRLTSYVGYTNNLKKDLNCTINSKGAKFTKGRSRNWHILKGINLKILL